VEFALYGSPGELPTFPDGEAEIGGVRVQVRGEEVPDDWEERWKRFHVPVLVAGKLWVRPPWEEPAVRPGVIEVVIDPGRAFGTGSITTSITPGRTAGSSHGGRTHSLPEIGRASCRERV